jgi:GR25 family glycosyltransferase involved in LPS biosynthesis
MENTTCVLSGGLPCSSDVERYSRIVEHFELEENSSTYRHRSLLPSVANQDPLSTDSRPRYRVVKNYVVNLDSRVDRMREFARHFQAQDIVVERVSAIDGKAMASGNARGQIPFDALDPSIVQPVYNVTEYAKRFANTTWKDGLPGGKIKFKSGMAQLSPGEIGNILSQTNLWRRIAERTDHNNFDLTCIFEDDAVPVPFFKRKLQMVLSELPVDEHIDLYFFNHCHSNIK